jgi:hypothetical protein
LKKNLFLLSDKPEDAAFAQALTEAAGLNLATLADAVELKGAIKASEVALILLDIAHPALAAFESEAQKLLFATQARLAPDYVHYITSPEDLGKTDPGRGALFGGSLIIRKFGANPGEAGRHFARVLRSNLERNAFGLQNQMPPGTPILTYRFNNSRQKDQGVQAAEKFVQDMGVLPRMVSVITNAVDEILMNAIFDAPSDDEGNRLYSQASRSMKIPVVNNKSVEMQLGVDGDYVGIAITDYCGTLKPEVILNHIARVLSGSQAAMSASTSGIGLSLVFRAGGSFLFATEPKVRTQATVFFKRTPNYKDFQSQFQFVSTQLYV